MATCYNCPFFQRIREGGRINCECATIKPPDKQFQEDFANEYCASGSGYKNCPFYKLLVEYYERKYSEGESHERREAD